jgi:subtilisin-like proprotein convertase family protein
LGPKNQLVQKLTVTDERGTPVPVEQLYFDKQQGQLLAITDDAVYAVDASGKATVARIPKDSGDPVYKKLAMRQTKFSSPEERADKARIGDISRRIQQGAYVSGEDKAFLDAYNGPVPQQQTNAPAREIRVTPTDPAELAAKELAIGEDQARRARGEKPVGSASQRYHFEGYAQRHPAATGALDVVDGCACSGASFNLGFNIPVEDHTDNDYCDPDSGAIVHVTILGGVGIIQDINLGFDITHTWVGDLVITVEHNGTKVHLKSHQPTGLGESCDNLVTTFDDEGAPFVEGACPHSGCTQTTDPSVCGNHLLSAFDGMPGDGTWIFTVSDVMGGDAGTWNGLSFCITDYVETAAVCNCPGPGFGSGPVNIPIPDATGTSNCNAINGISSSFSVPAGTGIISDVNVAVNLLHTWVGDLVIDVTHNATTVRLLTRAPFGFGESCDNLATVFDDEGTNWYPSHCPHPGCNRPYDPSNCGNHSLSAFNGMTADGVWTLKVVDVAAGDIGILQDWSVCFNAPDPPVCEQCPNGVLESGIIDLLIPDNTDPDACLALNGVSHTINVPPGSGIVQDVNIGLDIFHTFLGDLVIDITHNGTTVRLRSSEVIEDCDDFIGTVFDDQGAPYILGACPHPGCVQPFDLAGCGGLTSLSAFNGMPAEGPWTLRVADHFVIDVGILHDWHLCLSTTPAPGFVSVSVETPDFTCGVGGLTPNPFTYIVHATNTGDVPCDQVNLTLSAGAGPGGTATVAVPVQTIPSLAPGATVDLPYLVTITPSGTGGCIGGAITVFPANCPPYVIDFFCLIDVPGCIGTPAPCGCMDVVLAVDVTGSMFGAIDNVIAEVPNIISAANTASGGDLRLGLVTFRDQVMTLNNLTFNQAAVAANLASLAAFGGNNTPEPSDEALREIITQDALCTDGSEFTTNFRSSCVKVTVLITDAPPAGCDDAFSPGVDDVNAHQRAVDALAQNIHISAVQVPSFGLDPIAQPIMQDYANTTGGNYLLTNSDGSGTGAAIASIIENCGGARPPDDCLPEGPNCSAQDPEIFTSISGLIDDAVISVTGDSMRLDWRRVNDAEFYQVYMGGMSDLPGNFAPVGFALDTTYYLPATLLGKVPSSRTMGIYVQAKRAVAELVGANLACWPMDEGAGPTVEDFAQDHDGTIHGADWISTVPGHYGLRFGYGDYVDLQNDVQFYGQPLQVDACVTIPSYPTIQTGAFYIFSCHRYATWFQGFGLRIDVHGRLLSEVWNQNTQSWNTLWAPFNKVVPLGVPFLVTAVINGPNSLLLLNGDVVAAGTQNYNSITNGFHMTIGAHNYNDGRYQYHMRGDIHWLKIAQVPPLPPAPGSPTADN